MAYPHNLHAPTDIGSPAEVGICDRCGFLYPLGQLEWQFDVRGNALVNLGIRVCTRTCYDAPADILRPVIIIGPEGTVRNPRPAYWREESQGGVPAPADIGVFLSPNQIPEDGP